MTPTIGLYGLYVGVYRPVVGGKPVGGIQKSFETFLFVGEDVVLYPSLTPIEMEDIVILYARVNRLKDVL